ncbi:unnamed protein product, partial [Hymenolepis diminuta]
FHLLLYALKLRLLGFTLISVLLDVPKVAHPLSWRGGIQVPSDLRFCALSLPQPVASVTASARYSLPMGCRKLLCPEMSTCSLLLDSRTFVVL